MKEKLKVLALVLVAFTMSLSAQETVSTGDNISGASGSMSYTIGQSIFVQASGTNGSFSSSIQQSYVLYEEEGRTSIRKNLNINCLVYPNPTIDKLQIEFNSNEYIDPVYQLSDIQGNILYSKPKTNSITIIEMNNFNTGIYFLTVTNNNQTLKTYKIIKQ